jgi:uroporphyrin-3 C-methyltransferase
MAEKIENTSQAKIAELDENVKHLEQQIKQRQPSDWLLHEAEYLIRISARTLWLEHDTGAAIGLLKDADARLSELNDPTFLPVRETIHQDINALEVMPSLETDEVVLTLMALNKQVTQLPLSIIDLDAKKEQGPDLSLSDDINDWQTNLAKTWQKFLNDFIRVRQRSGSIEPLMSPEQQENLAQNLSLKIQLAIWAASERNGVIYQKALVDIQQWLNEFFDMKTNINQQFDKTLASLQEKQVNYNYPSELVSLSAIKLALINQTPKPTSTSLKEDEIESESLPTTPQEEDKTEVKKPVELPEQQQNAVKSEDSA